MVVALLMAAEQQVADAMAVAAALAVVIVVVAGVMRDINRKNGMARSQNAAGERLPPVQEP